MKITKAARNQPPTEPPMSNAFITRADSTITAHDFGANDSKGRAIGARIIAFTAKRGDATEGYCFFPHATRDGQLFGASQNDRTFTTPAARDEAVSAYLKAARARAGVKAPPAAKTEPAPAVDLYIEWCRRPFAERRQIAAYIVAKIGHEAAASQGYKSVVHSKLRNWGAYCENLVRSAA
jgi:hypothetical protein